MKYYLKFKFGNTNIWDYITKVNKKGMIKYSWDKDLVLLSFETESNALAYKDKLIKAKPYRKNRIVISKQ